MRPAVTGDRVPTSREGPPALGGVAVSRGGLGRDFWGWRPGGRSGCGPRAQAGVTGHGGARHVEEPRRQQDTEGGHKLLQAQHAGLGFRAAGLALPRLSSPCPQGDAGCPRGVGTGAASSAGHSCDRPRGTQFPEANQGHVRSREQNPA